MSDNVQEQITRLNRELRAEQCRTHKLETYVQKLAEAIQTGLPHMKLIDLTWHEDEANPHG